MVHLGGQTSKISKDLGNTISQLKSGKTRGSNPRDLSFEEITDLEQRRDTFKSQMRENAKNRITAHVNSHTTTEADRVIGCAQEASVPAQQYFAAIGGAGSSTDLRLQGKTLIERANAMQRESKKAMQQQQRAEQKAIKDAERRADTEKRKAEKRKAEMPKQVQKRRVSKPLQQLDSSPIDASPCNSGSSSAAQKAAAEDKFLASLPDDDDELPKCPF